MTERTLMKQTRAEVEDDAISITSSRSEKYSSDEEFLVERIMAEKKGDDGRMYFLVYWANYPVEKSTWEPRKNIQDPEIMQVWKERKGQEAKGSKKSFNIAEFNARLQELAQAKEDRRRRRKIKRKRLGIPVSPDPEIRRHAADSDSIEAVESDGLPDDYPGMKRKSKPAQVAKKPSKPSFVQPESLDIEPPPRRRASIQRDEYESDGAGTSDDSLIGDLQRKAEKKKVKKQALQAIRDNQATQGPSKVSKAQDKPTSTKKSSEKSKSTKPSSSSSPVVPLADDTEQRRRAQQQQRSTSTDTATSKQLASTIKGSPRPPATVAAPANTTSSTRKHPTGIGGSAAGRGKGATRGSSSLGPRNVFASRGPAKKRPTIIENSTDPSKDPKHYSNMHILWKAQKAGRELADAAPDVSAIGGLFDPSNPSSLQPLKPGALRKVSISIPSQQESNSMDMDDLFVSQNSPRGPAAMDPWAANPDVVNSAQPHSPPTYNPQPSRPQWQQRHGNNAICHFWNAKGTCSKGYLCDYKHNDDPHLPIGPPPPGHSSLSSTSAQTPANQHIPSTSSLDNQHIPPSHAPQPSRPSWQERHGHNSICYFWHAGGSCDKGYLCDYKHTDDPHLPLAPPPPGYGHYSPPPTLLPNGRPAWDKRDPLNAVCHFWYTKNGKCRKSNNCPYLHTDDIRLPIAPGPNRKTETCMYWAAGYCEKPASLCQFLHGYMDGPDATPESHESRQQPEPSAPVPIIRDGAVTVPAGPRKSVSFAVDEPMAFPDEPESYNPRKSAPIRKPSKRDPKYDRVCSFWEQGDCWRGDKCLYWHTYDGSDRQIEQTPASHLKEYAGREDPVLYMGQQTLEQDLNTTSPEGFHNATQVTEPFPPDHLNRLLRTEDTTLGFQPERTPMNLQTEDSKSGLPIQAVDSDQRQQTGKILSHLQTQLDSSDTLPAVQGTPEVASPKLRHAGTKMSMDGYRRKKAMKTLGERAKEVAFGKDETEFILVDFGDLNHAKQQPWGQSFAALTKFHFTQSCLAQDFKAQLGSLLCQTLWQGSLAVVDSEPQDQEALKILNKAWEHLRLNSAGFVCVCTDFVVLIYPAIEEWKFMERSASFSAEMRLRYLVFQTNLDLSTPPDTTLTSTPIDYRNSLVEAIHGLNFKTFVPKVKAGQKYHFYLLFPSTANKSADFMTTWLRGSSNQCKIYSSQTEGAWEFFVKDPKVDVGIVLIHESAIASVCELPSLRVLVGPLVPNKNISFWYIADGAAKYPMYGPPEGSKPGQITATRLLPHGHAFFLTPSFLISEPDKAYSLIRWFKGKFAKSTPGTWKLVCAHNIREYLLDIAIEKSAERDEIEAELQGQARKDAIMEEKGLGYAICALRFQMHELVVEMLSQPITEGYSDYDSDMPDESTSPIIYADEFVDANDEQALVTWFAGWAMCKLNQFRKFTVVGTAPRSEKRAVRRVVAARPESSKVDERVTPLSWKSKKVSKPELSKENERSTSPKPSKRPKSPKAGKRFRDHPTISSVEPSNIASTPVKGHERRTSAAESLASAAKLRALAVAAKLSSSNPSSAPASPPPLRAPEDNPIELKIKGLASMSPSTSALPTKPQLSQARSLGSLGGHAVTLPPRYHVIGTLGGHTLTLPHAISPTSPPEASDSELSVEITYSDHQQAPPEHGIVAQASPGTLQFVVDTGANPETTKAFFSRAGDKVNRASHLSSAETGSAPNPEGTDEPLPPQSMNSPHFNGPSILSLAQSDGPGDERPRSSGANSVSSSRSDIQSNENGRSFVLASVRASGTVRPELSIKPGYIPGEDQEAYRAPNRCLLDEGPQNEGSGNSSRNVSSRGSPAVNPAVGTGEKDIDMMNIDDPPVEESASGNGGVIKSREIVTKKIKYEATTTWYGRWYKEGKGWEHIYVESWEKAWKYLGVK